MPKYDKKADFQTIGFRAWRGVPGPMHGSHSHTELEWNFFVRGSARYFLAGRFYEVPSRRLAVFWAGIPHSLVSVETPVECLWVTVPLAWFMQWRLSETFAQRLLRGEMVLEPDVSRAAAETDLALLQRWVADLDGRAPEARRIVLLEVEARLRRLGLSAQRGAERRAAGVASGSPIERLTDYIGRNYRESLAIGDLAEVAGLHPNYLMQLFKRNCGMSLWEYVLRLRTSHAQRLLLMSDAKILDVALDSGFGSASRFYETFYRFCGQTPRDYRRAMGQRAADKTR